MILCPACHHEDHDPGSCPECPRCELHYDEAIEWLRRNVMLPPASLAEAEAPLRAAAQAVADMPPGNRGFIEKWQALRSILDAEAER